MLAAGFVVAFVAAFAFGALWRRAISARELAIERAEYAEALRVRVLFRGVPMLVLTITPSSSRRSGSGQSPVGEADPNLAQSPPDDVPGSR